MAPQHKPPIVISTFPTPGHRADINHGAEKSASMAGSFVHLKSVSFPKQLPSLIRCFKKQKRRPFWVEEGGTRYSKALRQKAHRLSPLGRRHLALIPAHLLQLHKHWTGWQ